MKESIREIGGSTLAIWYGGILNKISEYYCRRAEKFINKGKKTIVSNPTCKFVNPFTLIFNFTVNNTEKYQLVHQGNFKDRYKSWREKTDLYTEKKLIYAEELEVYENLNDKKGIDAPTPPTELPDSPLDNNEMFLIILPKEKSWHKKE